MEDFPEDLVAEDVLVAHERDHSAFGAEGFELDGSEGFVGGGVGDTEFFLRGATEAGDTFVVLGADAVDEVGVDGFVEGDDGEAAYRGVCGVESGLDFFAVFEVIVELESQDFD